jgi:hypothetical protein
MANFYLHDELRVNGLRKIAWASVFRLIFFVKFPNILISCLYVSKRKTELTENGYFCLFAANGTQKFVFLGRQTINANRRLLFRQKDIRTGGTNTILDRGGENGFGEKSVESKISH